MKYIRLFGSTNQRDAVLASIDYNILQKTVGVPGVSILQGQGGGPVPPTPSHDYVEIGGVKWATMNIGASTIYEPGLYFQWGDTQGYTASQVGEGDGQKFFGESDCKYYDGSSYTKYNYTDGKTVLDLEDDAVHAAWGGNWRMPTSSEFVALGDAVTIEWVYDYNNSGVDGLLCTDKTDNTKMLFFPAAGFCSYGTVQDGAACMCWNSSCDDGVSCFSYDGDLYWKIDSPRWTGMSCRGILDD